MKKAKKKLRFRVTVPGLSVGSLRWNYPGAPDPSAERVFFVYGRDQAEALGRLPSALLLDATVVREAGKVEFMRAAPEGP